MGNELDDGLQSRFALEPLCRRRCDTKVIVRRYDSIGDLVDEGQRTRSVPKNVNFSEPEIGHIEYLRILAE